MNPLFPHGWELQLLHTWNMRNIAKQLPQFQCSREGRATSEVGGAMSDETSRGHGIERYEHLATLFPQAAGGEHPGQKEETFHHQDNPMRLE